jgi:branched-chain amino acid transport system substrate-binding protein
MGGDGWDSPSLIKIGGKSMDGAFFSNHYSIEDKAPHVQDFIARYKKKYNGTVPDGLAAMGYDAAIVLIDAMNRAKSAEPKAIRDALTKTKDFQGVTGKITIDKDRNAQKSAVVLKIVKGVYKYETTINPS